MRNFDQKNFRTTVKFSQSALQLEGEQLQLSSSVALLSESVRAAKAVKEHGNNYTHQIIATTTHAAVTFSAAI